MPTPIDTKYQGGFAYAIFLDQAERTYTWRVVRSGGPSTLTIAEGIAPTPLGAFEDAEAARGNAMRSDANT
ncbi:MAG TPA: hypothetical protein VKZ50_12760 [bacterium]|nr:hypothetical protein [bacterium]